MTEAVPRLGIGMVGYAFMGVAHSQAWRNAPRFFDLPLRPDMAAVAGRDEAAVTRRGDEAGLVQHGDRLEGAGLPRRHRPGRHLHAGRHARRDRDRGARGRQARAVREAAGQLRRRRPRRWSARPRRSTGARDGRLHLPPRPRDPAGPHAGRGRPDRHGPARARAVPAGLDRRPAGAAVVAAGQAEGRLRGARGHRRAHRRPRPVRHGRVGHGRLGGAGDVRQGAPGRRRRSAGCTARRGTETGPGHGGRRRDLPRPDVRRGTGDVRGHPVRVGPQERDPARDQRVARVARVRLRGHERPALLRRVASPPPRPGSGGSSSPSPSTPTWQPGGRRVTASGTSTRSRTRRWTWSPRSPSTGSRSPASPTGSSCSGCWPRSSSPPRTTARGPPCTKES